MDENKIKEFEDSLQRYELLIQLFGSDEPGDLIYRLRDTGREAMFPDDVTDDMLAKFKNEIVPVIAELRRKLNCRREIIEEALRKLMEV